MTTHDDRLEAVWQDVKDLGVYEVIEDFEYGATAPVVKLPSGEITFIEGETGREGGPTDIWVVFAFEDKLYRINGYYGSWSGTEWNTHVEEVQAKEKIVIIYEKV